MCQIKKLNLIFDIAMFRHQQVRNERDVIRLFCFDIFLHHPMGIAHFVKNRFVKINKDDRNIISGPLC